jgi:NADH pyrophosphatase NudC (nudix superfamily)
MAAMTLRGKRMDNFINALRQDFPHLQFTEGDAFCWSPVTSEIIYKRGLKRTDRAKYSIIHELSHALLDHTKYNTDYELLQLEIAAWEHAKKIAKRYSISIDDNHVQNCLESYRTWIYRRSICPQCGCKSIQSDDATFYQCFNCHSRWLVAASKFCRTYRHFKGYKKSPSTTGV